MAGRNHELLGVRQAGEVLQVSTATIWRLIRSGALASVKRAGRRLVPASALLRRASRPRVPSFDLHHPIFRLVGAGRSGGARPGARDKHGIVDE